MDRFIDFKIGERIEQIQSERGLSDGKMGDIIGVDRKTYRDYRLGITDMRSTQLKVFCQRFGVSADYLLFGGKKR